MAVPNSRQQFAQFCLRRLGSPVIKINVAESQVSDCIDQALYLYSQYHCDGSENTYFKYQLTQTDITNSFITLPDQIIGVESIFPLGQSIGTNSLFNMRYQFIINDLYNFSNVSLLPYYMMMNHVQFMEEMLVGQKPIRFNRHNNILYLDMDMSIAVAGEWVIVVANQVLDPVMYPNVWSDIWLQEYTVALIKVQWGQIISKFSVPMPGNMQLNGQLIYTEGMKEKERLEERLLTHYSMPPHMMTG
jgi:hypothetical protein